jgi:hypothetical protein
MFGAVERLLAGAAVLGAGLYVLVNALYIEFYDDFGVRPEQVGFDRLAVLARSAWVALIVVALIGPVGIVVVRRSQQKLWGQLEVEWSEEEEAEFSGLSAAELRERNLRLDQVKSAVDMLRGIAMLLLVVSAAVVAGFVLLAWLVEREAERVADGHNVNGLGPLVPFIDVRANRAEVMWLDPDKTAPAGLEDAEYVAYLGSGADTTVLLACGETTYLVQSSDVAVTLLDQGEHRLSDEDETAAFKKACG